MSPRPRPKHLDIVSREWMEDALSDYGETLLFVSHDRYFIEKFATRIWAFEDGKLTDYRGGYAAYVAWRQRQEIYSQAEKKAERTDSGSDKKTPIRPHAGNHARQIQRVEKEIARLESQLRSLEEECEQNATDYQKLMTLEEQKEALNSALMELYERWEALCDET